jgi:hypothetical protein
LQFEPVVQPVRGKAALRNLADVNVELCEPLTALFDDLKLRGWTPSPSLAGAVVVVEVLILWRLFAASLTSRSCLCSGFADASFSGFTFDGNESTDVPPNEGP